MDRRHFLTGLGAGVIGLSGSGIAASASSGLIQGTGKTAQLSEAHRPIHSCKIIGMGGAGRNFVMASHSGEFLANSEWTPEFICIDLDGERLKQVDAANRAAPGQFPIKSMALGTCGAGGWINAARVAALRNRDALKNLLDGAEVVCLLAGLGGGTGSGVTPIMARLARDAGARTVAAVITPFEY